MAAIKGATANETPQKASSSLVGFIKDYETFYATPYDDGLGNMTIGYGHVIQKSENFTTITKADAEKLLIKDMAQWEREVYKYSTELGIVWDQQQYDAFVDLAFNSGYNYKYVVDRIHKKGMTPEGAFMYAYNTRTVSRKCCIRTI